ncbi:MAG: glycosyltransferase family 2 protein [Cytophagaceae bacterium]|jgi:GT2 family glycosyltransferase|nr:glycosyltransferase family 2 protein [Cytophagaceae bacterium]
MIKLSVVIVNYNVSHFLEQCLVSVFQALKEVPSEVFVVDNNSVDGSDEMVRSRFPQARLIANQENLGFSKANNQAIRLAKGEYVLLLNPDTIVEEDTFVKCIDFMDTHPQAGALGVKMLDGSGNFLPESKRGLPTPWVAFYKIFGLSALFPKSKKFGGYHLGYLHPNQTHEVTILSGAYMFMRKGALDKSGLLDETFFMYGEDIDLSYRIIKEGYKNYYFPETRIIHYKGESTRKSSVNYVFVFYKAMIIFAKKHFSQRHAGIFSLLINLAIYLRASMSLAARVVKALTLPAIDAVTIYSGYYFLKNFWVNTFKHSIQYPSEYMLLVAPSYLLIWLGSVYLNSGYSWPVRGRRIIRGILFGTVIISVMSNFMEEYRFSKALIILGTGWSIVAMFGIRSIWNLIRYKTIRFSSSRVKTVLIIGKSEESNRIIQLLRSQYNNNLIVAGYMHPEQRILSDPACLGDTSKMQEIIDVFRVDELIFCSRDVSAQYIINCMTDVFRRAVEFKIVSDGSDYVVGSTSKNKQGDFYSLSIQLGIINEENIRNKRLLDVGVALLLLPLSPILAPCMKNPGRYLWNLLQVLAGKYSWVGYSRDIQIKLPKIRKGILSPSESNDQKEINQLNFRYARDYSPYWDLKIIIHSFRQLGRNE